MEARKVKIITVALLSAAVLMALSATAEAKNSVMKLENWQYNGIYDVGFSVEEFLDAEVYDEEGDEIGEVEDLVVSANGNRVTGIIIETGGFLDIGDSHLVYPYDKAEIRGVDAVRVTIDGENVENFSLFNDVEGDDVLPGGQWRITDLIGDYAYASGTPYGWVDDVAINNAGEILAVIIEPDVTVANDYGYYGYYATPFYGYDYGFDPTIGYYDVPYTAEQIDSLEPFDYDELTDH